MVIIILEHNSHIHFVPTHPTMLEHILIDFNAISHCRHLSEDGLKKISDEGSITDTKELVKRALDVSFALQQLNLRPTYNETN